MLTRISELSIEQGTAMVVHSSTTPSDRNKYCHIQCYYEPIIDKVARFRTTCPRCKEVIAPQSPIEKHGTEFWTDNITIRKASTINLDCRRHTRDQRRIPNFRYHIVFKFITCIYFRTWTLNVLQYINQKKTRRWLYNSSENVSAYHIHSYTRESGCGRGAQNSLY